MSNVRRHALTTLLPMKLTRTIACCLTAISLNASAQAPKYLGRYESTSADLQAIEMVTKDFQAALVAKDPRKLSTLFLNQSILFSTPASPSEVQKRRQERNVHSDGIGSGAVSSFVDFVATSKVPIEERFHNVRITQDGHLAWVIFDFEFLEDSKVQNYGIEVWQMIKVPNDNWKILSVVWSSHGAPKLPP